MGDTLRIRDPNGNEWEILRETVEFLGFSDGQQLTKPEMDDLLHEIMAGVSVAINIKPARPH